MFLVLKSEVDTRFNDIEEYFDSTKILHENQIAVAKGLVFVQVYAVYEFTVNKTVSEAIDAIKVHNHEIGDLLPSLLTLFLDPEIRSLRDTQRRNEWQSRLNLFERAFSSKILDLASDTNPPNDGSHYRYSQLVLIFDVFGIKRMPVPRRRHIQRIEEVVSHRNAIAHGRDTPQDVGRRYTRAEIRKTVRQMRSICMLWIRVIESYCADPARHGR